MKGWVDTDMSRHPLTNKPSGLFRDLLDKVLLVSEIR